MVDQPEVHKEEEIAASNASEDKDNSSSGRMLGTLGSARQAFTRSYDRVTGAEFRRQFDEFSNAITTTVLGVHRDQNELRDQLSQLGDVLESNRTWTNETIEEASTRFSVLENKVQELNDNAAKVKSLIESRRVIYFGSRSHVSMMAFSGIGLIIALIAAVRTF